MCVLFIVVICCLPFVLTLTLVTQVSSKYSLLKLTHAFATCSWYGTEYKQINIPSYCIYTDTVCLKDKQNTTKIINPKKQTNKKQTKTKTNKQTNAKIYAKDVMLMQHSFKYSSKYGLSSNKIPKNPNMVIIFHNATIVVVK